MVFLISDECAKEVAMCMDDAALATFFLRSLVPLHEVCEKDDTIEVMINEIVAAKYKENDRIRESVLRQSLK